MMGDGRLDEEEQTMSKADAEDEEGQWERGDRRWRGAGAQGRGHGGIMRGMRRKGSRVKGQGSRVKGHTMGHSKGAVYRACRPR
eukprot:7387050-Pyramimonas_sp.AAC.1